ncbi:YkgJ family cysteine cluster protein [Desulfovibrio inopinatus]|uniref:YkgJ family cysteine cluster protein n=1 Tax=Desulfovibrio inopinatus TaxID=102109 RepID=UPI0003FFB64A|nr:YkgJ family cysteine cluster protein [Desulfovibrio inopinatus]
MSDHDATDRFLKSLPELNPGESFQFACHPEVPCFNACCSDLTLMLTPYDVYRLRQALHLTSQEFINNYATLTHSPDTGFPMLHLNMEDNAQKSCPFVTAKGCAVYPNRPGACRTYPLGRATRLDNEDNIIEQFFIVQEPHCRGFEQSQNWTSAEWLKDQDLATYNEFNDKYMRLMALARDKRVRLNPKQTNMAFLAQYNLDGFRGFLDEIGILDRLNIEDARKQAILKDDLECLIFGLEWLGLVFFGENRHLRP